MSSLQSIEARRFDNVNAIYLLLLDRWKRHNSQKSSDSCRLVTPLPMRTERRSSITTGKGENSSSLLCFPIACELCVARWLSDYRVLGSQSAGCCFRLGVLASGSSREAWRPSPPQKVDPTAFSGQRQGWKTPKRTLWQCTASVCVAGVYCWEISLGLADPWNVIFCLSC